MNTADVTEALARGETLPWSWYGDPQVLRREQERIFARFWQYVGHAGQVAEPGSFFAARAGDIPVAVLRDEAGALRAFLNVCRHRGHEVVHGEGRRATLQCPYHAWTYALDGSLRAAPRSDREEGFDRSGLGLRPVQVDTWGPLVFVNPDREAPPLPEVLGELPAIVARSGVDIGGLRHHSRSDYALNANWKIAVENFLECYHCPTAHPSFSEVVDVDRDAYRLEAHDGFWSQYGPLRPQNGRQAYDARGEAFEGQFHLLFPNFKFNIMPGRPNLSVGPLLPDGPQRSTGFFDYFFGEDVDGAWIEAMIEFDTQVGREDTALVESVQRGIGSGVLERGRLMLSSEHLIAGFQRRVAEALAD